MALKRNRAFKQRDTDLHGTGAVLAQEDRDVQVNDTADDEGRPPRKRCESFSTILIVLIFVMGLTIMLYPSISDWWNSRYATHVITQYQEVVASMTDEERAQLFVQAESYNQHLDQLSDHFSQALQLEDEYRAALNVTGDGLIGFVTVDKIDVRLPIYHGTSEGTLQRAAGHLEGSHLPTGGKGRHTAVSAHRGLPSALLFTYLDELVEGDYFTVTVLDKEFYYQVDQIRIVEPQQIDDLLPTQDADYATLQTCTPYGVNSHRMLVRGHRVDGIPDDLVGESDARRVPIHIMAPAVAVPILLLALVGLLVASRRKPARLTEEDQRAVSIAPELEHPNADNPDARREDHER